MDGGGQSSGGRERTWSANSAVGQREQRPNASGSPYVGGVSGARMVGTPTEPFLNDQNRQGNMYNCGHCHRSLGMKGAEATVKCQHCGKTNVHDPTNLRNILFTCFGFALFLIVASVGVFVAFYIMKHKWLDYISYACFGVSALGVLLIFLSAVFLFINYNRAVAYVPPVQHTSASTPTYMPPTPKLRVGGLHAAAYAGKLEFIKSLVNEGLDPLTMSAEGVCGLQYAAVGGHASVASFFLENGQDPDTKSPKGSYPILEAAHKGHTDVIAALHEYGADLNVKSPKGLTALSLAINAGHMEAARFLLECGADPNACSPQGSCPVLVAAVANRPDFLELLHEFNADLNTQNLHGMTALHFAVQNQKPDLIRLLLSLGARTDIEEKHGWTPSLLAQVQNKTKMLQVLDAERTRSGVEQNGADIPQNVGNRISEASADLPNIGASQGCESPSLLQSMMGEHEAPRSNVPTAVAGNAPSRIEN